MIPYHTNSHILGIPWYFLMYWLGWLMGFYVILKESDRQNLNKKHLSIILLSTLVASPLFGRIFYFFGPWRPHGLPLSLFFDITFDAYVFFGNVFGGILALILVSKFFKINLWNVLDVFALALSIGMFFGRIGCFLAGCCGGSHTHFGFALQHNDIGKYPTQTISSFYNFMIFIFLTKFKVKKRFDGQIALLFLMIYSVCRFLIEFFRAYDWHMFGLTSSQYISLIAFIISIIIYIKKNQQVISYNNKKLNL